MSITIDQCMYFRPKTDFDWFKSMIVLLPLLLISNVNLHSQENLGEELFSIVDEMPRFPGCEKIKNFDKKNECSKNKLLTYLGQNISIPLNLRDNVLEIKAVVQFEVTTNGTIEGVKIIRDPGFGLGEEVVRSVLSMNELKDRWIPAKKDNLPIKFNYTVPLNFKIN
jgi:periplasmic protein TonB